MESWVWENYVFKKPKISITTVKTEVEKSSSCKVIVIQHEKTNIKEHTSLV
jgi:hypothetical protein